MSPASRTQRLLPEKILGVLDRQGGHLIHWLATAFKMRRAILAVAPFRNLYFEFAFLAAINVTDLGSVHVSPLLEVWGLRILLSPIPNVHLQQTNQYAGWWREPIIASFNQPVVGTLSTDYYTLSLARGVLRKLTDIDKQLKESIRFSPDRGSR